jgi:hypothetical protein
VAAELNRTRPDPRTVEKLRCAARSELAVAEALLQALDDCRSDRPRFWYGYQCR